LQSVFDICHAPEFFITVSHTSFFYATCFRRRFSLFLLPLSACFGLLLLLFGCHFAFGLSPLCLLWLLLGCLFAFG
jgi:hypothetical protein